MQEPAASSGGDRVEWLSGAITAYTDLVTPGGEPGRPEPNPIATYYHTAGTRPLVFLVTGVGTRSIWNYAAPELHRLGFDVFVYQQPGFGGDSSDLKALELPYFVDSLKATFRAARMARQEYSTSVHLVGHSFGAVVSICCAEGISGEIDSIHLISPALSVCPRARRRMISATQTRPPHQRVLEEVSLYRRPPGEFLGRLVWAGDTASRLLSSVNCPTWVYEGELDDRVAPLSEELKLRFADLRGVRVLRNSGHFVPMDWDAESLVAQIHAAVASL